MSRKWLQILKGAIRNILLQIMKELPKGRPEVEPEMELGDRNGTRGQK